ncbi:hypothetical protein ABEB36_011359 [Hypothenemus hampei]|uniref:Uncharacterized protein n=1 Tax=Hypothenemus hampei TaxID=57062 RepID=A0ABD1EF61_HYPHA
MELTINEKKTKYMVWSDRDFVKERNLDVATKEDKILRYNELTSLYLCKTVIRPVVTFACEMWIPKKAKLMERESINKMLKVLNIENDTVEKHRREKKVSGGHGPIRSTRLFYNTNTKIKSPVQGINVAFTGNNRNVGNRVVAMVSSDEESVTLFAACDQENNKHE